MRQSLVVRAYRITLVVAWLLPTHAWQGADVFAVLDRADKLGRVALVLGWRSAGFRFGSSHFEGESGHDCVHMAAWLYAFRSAGLPYIFVFLEQGTVAVYSQLLQRDGSCNDLLQAGVSLFVRV